MNRQGNMQKLRNFKEMSYVVGIWTEFGDKNHGKYAQEDKN